MTRYCAATCCKNRGGQATGTQRKVSFYPLSEPYNRKEITRYRGVTIEEAGPVAAGGSGGTGSSWFPLHDRGRLQEWLRNMKQYKWYPTKHQVLCSDHFTADSFSVRWGIRYLKPNAIPTLFSFTKKPQDTSELEPTLKEGTNVKIDTDTVTSQDFCPNTNNTLSHGFDTDEYLDFDCKQVNLKNTMDGLTVSDKKPKDLYLPNSDCETQPHLTPSKFCQTCPENLIVGSVANLNCQNNQVCFELQPDQNDVAENVATYQLDHYSDVQKVTFPLSLLQQMDEEKDSVITITVQSGLDGGVISDNPPFSSSKKLGFENDVHSTNEIFESEHSYCRQITDRHYLWQKIAKLQSKIAVLEAQENATLSRLRSLESVIMQLKQENLLSDEKLKILENCCSRVDIAII